MAVLAAIVLVGCTIQHRPQPRAEALGDIPRVEAARPVRIVNTTPDKEVMLTVRPYDVPVSYKRYADIAIQLWSDELEKLGGKVQADASKELTLTLTDISIVPGFGTFTCLINFTVGTGGGYRRGFEVSERSWAYKQAIDGAIVNVVKSVLTNETLRGYLTTVDTASASEALASNPPPPATLSRPTIAVLEPKPGSVLRGESVTLRFQVTSGRGLSRLVVKAQGREFLLPAVVKAGEPWAGETTVPLAEGENLVEIRVVDEQGATAEERLVLKRESLVAVEVRGPPSAEVILEGAHYTLDGSGKLGLQLPPGAYQIEGRMMGFAPSRDRLIVISGRPVQHRLSLIPLTQPVTDSGPPTILLSYPVADMTVAVDSVLITALVTDDVAVGRVQVLVNGAEAAEAIEVPEGTKGVPVRARIPLRLGHNVIEITATDRAGNVAQLVRTVTRVTPALPTGELLAVIVGIGAYDHASIPRLRYAARDAEAIYEVLTTRGGFKKENVLLMTEGTTQRPTLRNIKSALGTFLARSAKKNDTVLVFFAGHGAPELDPRGIERDGLAKYLIPIDADPDDLYATALSMDEIQTIFTRIYAERLVMFVDSCYSGAAGGRTFASPRARTRDITIDDQFLERLTRGKGRAIVTAARSSEVSLELSELGHGVFTYYLVEGLRGAADTDQDGVVTLQELYDYVASRVTAKSRMVGGSQHPMMKGELDGPLPLVQLKR